MDLAVVLIEAEEPGPLAAINRAERLKHKAIAGVQVSAAVAIEAVAADVVAAAEADANVRL